ncbi:TAXI family TRAP transporter solute-binding subunit [Chloroflexota bacterium]
MRLKSFFSFSAIITILIVTVFILTACGAPAPAPAPAPKAPAAPADPQAPKAQAVPGKKIAPVIGKEIDTSHPLADDFGPLKIDMPGFMTYSGTSAPTSIYTFYSNPILNALAEAFPQMAVRHLPGGTKTNMVRVIEGTAQFGIGNLTEAAAATYPWRDDYPEPQDVGILFSSPTPYHNAAPIVLPGSPIKSMKDIKGKRITPIYAGATTYRVLVPGLLAHYGWTYADVDPRPASGNWKEDCFNKLFNDETDILFFSMPVPDPFVKAKELVRELVLLDITDEEMAGSLANSAGYFHYVMPKDALKCVNQDKPQNAWGVIFNIWARNDLPEEVVYNMTWAAFRDDGKALNESHPALAEIDFAKAMSEPTSIGAPVHAGASKYWESKGVTIPPVLPTPAVWK